MFNRRRPSASHVRDAVYSAFTGRPAEERTSNHTEQFVDEMWAQGLRLAKTQHLHYQLVMDVIRPRIHH